MIQFNNRASTSPPSGGLRGAIETIAGEITLMAQAILADDSISANAKTGKNTLRNSLLAKDVQASVHFGDNVVIDVLFGNYIAYIEQGRAPRSGKRPPISAIKSWAEKRGIATDNNTLYAIANAVWRDGYAGRPILATLEQQIEERFDNEWADLIFEALFS